MKRRIAYAAAAAALMLLVFALVFKPSENEPHYKGKRLSSWLLLYKDAIISSFVADSAEPSISPEPEIAIRAIGTNALPYMLKWLQYKETATRKHVTAFVRDLPLRLRYSRPAEWLARDPKADLSISAMCAFRALGTNATPAILELASLARNTNQSDAAGILAIYALVYTGDNAISVLATNLANIPSRRRIALAQALGGPWLSVETRLRVPLLLQCLDDPDPSVAAEAARSLAQLEAEPDTVIPALQRVAENGGPNTSVAAIEALSQFGTNARSAVPILMKWLFPPGTREAEASTNALLLIAPEALTNAPAQ